MKIKNAFVAGLSFLLLSTNAGAVVNNTINGVDYQWLELTETAGQSRNQVELMLANPNSFLYGYEYASRSLIEDLFLSYIPSWDGEDGYETDPFVVSGNRALVDAFGMLESVSYAKAKTLYGVKYNSVFWSHGLYGSTDECGTDSQSCLTTTNYYSRFDHVEVLADIHNVDGYNSSGGVQLWDSNRGRNDTGSYLVKTITAPIPEPETYAMLLAGLGLLGLMTRRRKQKLPA